MTPFQAGVTHDVVIHVNDSVQVGLMLMPNTYRIRNAPTFLPRLAVGDPSGIDKGRWKSWIQHRFDGGAGQIFHTGTEAGSRYAESNLVDLGMPVNVVGGLAGRTGARGVGMQPTTEPEGLFAGAITPRATTAETPMAALFTKSWPVYVFEMSNRPHVINYATLAQYKGAETILSGGAVAQWQDPLQLGIWSVVASALSPVQSAVRFSGVIVAAGADHDIRVYGDQGAAALVYTPAYNTLADRVENYDNRLWKTLGAKAAVLTLQAGNMSIPAFAWSDHKEVGDQTTVINNTCVYGGRLYFGKEDALWVFDAGRIYPVETSFRWVRDPSNFSLMCEHKGAMYFNIRQRVYRYSAGGMFELLAMPDFDGVVADGYSSGDELHIVVQTNTGEGEVWIFNSDTGGCRRWFASSEFSWGSDPNNPQGIAGGGVAYGYEWILPVQASSAYSAGSPYISGIAAANRISPARTQIVPYFAKTHSYLIMSMEDMGYPDLGKLFNAVKLDYGLYSTGDRIDISYLLELKGPRIVGAFLYDDTAATWYDGTAELTDGSVLVEEGALDVTTTQYDLYVLFESPIEAMRLVMGAQHQGITGGSWQYYNGISWNNISGAALFHLLTEAGDILTTEAGDRLLGSSEGMRINDGTLYLTRTGFVFPGNLSDWVQTTIQGVTGYALRYSSPVGASSRMQFTEAVGIKSLRKQDWIKLGSLGAADMGAVKKTLQFPEGTNARGIMLMFDLWGTNATRPEVKRVEIEHDTEVSNLCIVDFAAFSMNPTWRLDRNLENSGAFVAASLFSMSRAPRLFVAQLPWPVAGMTIRAHVSITDPGAHVPVLAYQTSWPGAPIPVRLDEM